LRSYIDILKRTLYIRFARVGACFSIYSRLHLECVRHFSNLKSQSVLSYADILERKLYIRLIEYIECYGVATISRLPKNMGLFCKRAL